MSKATAPGVRSLLMGDDVDAKSVAPDLNLVYGGCAECVGCAYEYAFAFVLVELGELGDAGGLAYAVDADHQDDERLFIDFERLIDVLEVNEAEHLFAEQGECVLGV